MAHIIQALYISKQYIGVQYEGAICIGTHYLRHVI